jgi:hypothetical protein
MRWACACRGTNVAVSADRTTHNATKNEAKRDFEQRFMVSVQRLLKRVSEGVILRARSLTAVVPGAKRNVTCAPEPHGAEAAAKAPILMVTKTGLCAVLSTEFSYF